MDVVVAPLLPLKINEKEFINSIRIFYEFFKNWIAKKIIISLNKEFLIFLQTLKLRIKPL